MKYYSGFKIRLFPNKVQEAKMFLHYHACRFLWNLLLENQNTIYQTSGGHMSAFDMINCLKDIRNQNEWLNNASRNSLSIVCRDLDKAFNNFFNKKKKYPKFKSRKRSKVSFPIRDTVWIDNNNFAHMEKIGQVKIKTDFNLTKNRKRILKNTRIVREKDKWFLCFVMECENQIQDNKSGIMGIDLNVKKSGHVAYINGESMCFSNINKSKKIRCLLQRLKHVNRTISRKFNQNKIGNKFVHTKNIDKALKKRKHIYDKIVGIRNNYIHQSTHSLILLNPKTVIMEDLNISNLVKNHKMANAIYDQCFYKWRYQMQYKCERNGIEFKCADRFFPSSKTCSCCGNINSLLKLSDEIFNCPNCGVSINRDLNAAINLSRYKG